MYDDYKVRGLSDYDIYCLYQKGLLVDFEDFLKCRNGRIVLRMLDEIDDSDYSIHKRKLQTD